MWAGGITFLETTWFQPWWSVWAADSILQVFSFDMTDKPLANVKHQIMKELT
jgi:hypothetical protein